MKRNKFGLFLLTILLFCPALTFGKDYFLYDAADKKILLMGTQETVFANKIDMTKKPDLIMRTNDPHKYLAIYGPVLERKQRSGSNRKETKNDTQAGQLILFNTATGRTEDLVELGYKPFSWTYTEDHRHFFVSFKKSANENSAFELLHYDTSQLKSEKTYLPDVTKNINKMAVAPDNQTLLVLVDNKKRIFDSNSYYNWQKEKNKGKPELLTLKFDPLTVKNTLPLKNGPTELYILNDNQVALICQDWAFYVEREFLSSPKLGFNLGNGSINIIDIKENKVIKEEKIKRSYIFTKWFENEKVLLVEYWNRGKDKFCFLKVSPDTIKSNEINEYNDYEYLPDKDRLYILASDYLRIIDYPKDSETNIQTGSNMYKKKANYFLRLPESDLFGIYSYQDGKVKFFNLADHIISGKSFSGRARARSFALFAKLFGKKRIANPMITTNNDQSKIFVYNSITNDITAFDRSYKKIAYINAPEKIWGTYQIKKPNLQTLVVTAKKIYKLNPDNLTLNPIYDLKRKTEGLTIYEEERRIIIDSDHEVLVLDPNTLEVMNHLEYLVNSRDKNSTLKPGMQRYYFIQTL